MLLDAVAEREGLVPADADVEAEVAALGGKATGRECEVASSAAIEGFLDEVIAWADGQ